MALSIMNFQSTMRKKAKKHGICENFGQAELRKLKERYNYDPHGTPTQRETARAIDALDAWCSNFTHPNN